jgi:hypothetical protein
VSRVAQYNVWLRAGRSGDRGSIPGKGEMIFPPTSVSRPSLGPTQSPVQWVPGVLSPGLKRGRGVTPTHSHLVPRMSRSYILLRNASMVCSRTAKATQATETQCRHTSSAETVTDRDVYTAVRFLFLFVAHTSCLPPAHSAWLGWLAGCRVARHLVKEERRHRHKVEEGH